MTANRQMCDQEHMLIAGRKQMKFHLEAASAWAEEVGDEYAQKLIDSVRQEVEQAASVQTPEKK
jgi:hypothetical protein